MALTNRLGVTALIGRDELKQPLRKRGLIERLWAHRPSLLAVATVAVISGFAGATTWVVRQQHPFAGEPIITVAIPPPEKLKTVASIEQGGDDQPAEPGSDPDMVDTATIDPDAAPPDDSQFVTPERKSVSDDEVTIITTGRQSLKPPADMLMEATPDGKLPRATARAKPMDYYARTVSLSVVHSDKPKIAIVLGGMGLNPRLTLEASANLPGDVTFAFAPYGDDLQNQVNNARSSGHEVLLQLPMEPVGYPANNPGPKTLLADADAQANLESLRWHMSRFAGYTGVTNYLGGRMLTSAAALKPIMLELQKRGLLYLEDGASAITASQDVARQLRLPIKRGQIVIDADPSREAILAALELLENEARTNGTAIGTGSGLQITTEVVQEWAKNLRDKDILLVPLSAVYKGRLG